MRLPESTHPPGTKIYLSGFGGVAGDGTLSKVSRSSGFLISSILSRGSHTPLIGIFPPLSWKNNARIPATLVQAELSIQLSL